MSENEYINWLDIGMTCDELTAPQKKALSFLGSRRDSAMGGHSAASLFVSGATLSTLCRRGLVNSVCHSPSGPPQYSLTDKGRRVHDHCLRRVAP